MTSLDNALKRPLKLAKATKLPAIEAGTWYGTPALLMNGKGFMRVKDAGTLVFRCSMEEKELLMEAAPDIYFETDHYKGWSIVLVRLPQIADAQLRQCIVHAWREVAPRALVKAYAAEPAQKAAGAKAARKKTRKKT